MAPERRMVPRRGAALLIALAMIVLGGALLAGTMASARMAHRSAQSYVSIALAESRWRSDMAGFMVSWDSSMSSLAPGSGLSSVIGPSTVGINGEVAKTRIRLLRLDSHHFLLAGATQVGPDSAVRARRRASLLLEVIPPADTMIPPLMPIVIQQWARHFIY